MAVVVVALAGVFGFIGVTVVAGVGLATLVSDRYGQATGEGPARAGESFGVLDSVLSGLAFATLIVTLWIQFRELNLQRAELRMQRDAIERSNEELHSTAQASMRMLHFDLVKLAIEDENLARVWHNWTDELSTERYRQHLYANLIYQHIVLLMKVAGYSEEEMRNSIRLVFQNPIMREYWMRAAESRALSQVPGSYPWRMARLSNEVLREYEPDAVLADDPPDR